MPVVKPKELFGAARQKLPPLDHLIRAYQRFTADAGNRQAAAVTFFGFLSFFPVLALVASLLGFFLGDQAINEVVNQVDSYAPGLADQLGLREILTDNRVAGISGLVGLAGLLYSGLGWVDALREAIRAMWHHNVQAGNIVVKKLKDILVLLGIGGTILMSVVVSAATGAFTGFALDLVGLQETSAATLIARLSGYALGLLTSFLLFLFLFVRLPKVTTPWRRVAKGALLAAVLFEVLKRAGAIYIERTTGNPLYGGFAVIVGLLVWINIVSRMLLLVAAWTVTAPYDSDIAPSGTANPELAEEAGVPVEFADNDPDDPPTLQEDGAPSPLAAAIEGKTPSQDVPEGRALVGAGARRGGAPDQSDGLSTKRASAAQGGEAQPPGRGGSAARDAARSGAGDSDGRKGRANTGASASLGSTATMASPDGPPARTRTLVQQAGQFSAGALGMVVMAVVLYVGRTVRELVRR